MNEALEPVAKDEELDSRRQCFLVPSLCALGDKMKVYLKMRKFGSRVRQQEAYRILEANRLFNKLASLNKKNCSSVKKAKVRTMAWKLTLSRMFGPDTEQLQIFIKQQMIEMFNGWNTRPALKLASDNSHNAEPFIGDQKVVGSNSGSEVYQLLIAGEYHLKVIATPLSRKNQSFESLDLQIPSDITKSNAAKGKSLSFKTWLEDRERKIADYEHLLKSAKKELCVSAQELIKTVEELDGTKREKQALEKEISEFKGTVEGLKSDLEFSRKMNNETVQKFESLVKQLQEELLSLSRTTIPTLSKENIQELKYEIRNKSSFLKNMRVKMCCFAAILLRYCWRFISRKTR